MRRTVSNQGEFQIVARFTGRANAHSALRRIILQFLKETPIAIGVQIDNLKCTLNQTKVSSKSTDDIAHHP